MKFFKKKLFRNKTQKSPHTTLVESVEGYRSYDVRDDRHKTDTAIRKHLLSSIAKIVELQAKSATFLLTKKILGGWHASNETDKYLASLKKLLDIKNVDIYRHTTFFMTSDISPWIDVPVIYDLEVEMILLTETLFTSLTQLIEALSLFQLTPESATQPELEALAIKVAKNVKTLYSMVSERAELLSSFEIVTF